VTVGPYVLLGTYLRTGAGFLRGALRLDRAEEARLLAEAARQIERVGLSAAQNKKFKAYSLGMRQRLGLAQATRPQAATRSNQLSS
jgi:branched-chain amino acid transport system permease protein